MGYSLSLFVFSNHTAAFHFSWQDTTDTQLVTAATAHLLPRVELNERQTMDVS